LGENSVDERIAWRLRGFGLLGIVAMLIVLGGNFLFTPLSGILVLVWAWISKTPWRDLGSVRPRSWFGTIALGIIFGVTLKFAMKAIVMPLLGAPAVNGPFHYLAHNPAEIPAMLYIIIIGAGFGEEMVFRGWAFERSANCSVRPGGRKRSRSCLPQRGLARRIMVCRESPAFKTPPLLGWSSERSSP
jgi:hypothetical protein